MLGNNSYIFQHQGVVLSEFIKNKGSYVEHVLQVFVGPTEFLLCFLKVLNSL
jgi:hypothetical protein